MKEDFREFVSPGVVDTVETSGKLYGKGHRIHDKMDEIEKAELTMQEKVVNKWSLRFEINHMSALQLSNEDELSAEIWEVISQFVTLLEAIHYSERKAVIKEFNNSLKKADNGSSTEK